MTFAPQKLFFAFWSQYVIEWVMEKYFHLRTLALEALIP